MREENLLHAYREDTLAFRRQAVERVIKVVGGRLDEPPSLKEMGSKIAYVSPFHFTRIFHQATGLPPSKFFSAMRLEAAKRFLLTTSLSVTDVCYEVGYSSLGTFTRRFTQSVGLPPSELRHFAERMNPALFRSMCTSFAERNSSSSGAFISGTIDSSLPIEGPVFIGLFPADTPQSYPASGTVLTQLGSFTITNIPNGVYYLLAVALPKCEDALACLLPERECTLVSAGKESLVISNTMSHEHVSISLRRMQVTDPPLLILLPLLLTNGLNDDRHAHHTDGFQRNQW